MDKINIDLSNAYISLLKGIVINLGYYFKL